MSFSSARYLGTDLDRRYRLDRLVGEGASAWVFAAQDKRLEREIAIKLLKPHEAGLRPGQEQFVEEGRTLAKLVHPHVVLVHDAAETPEGLCYLVMELSSEGTLEAELAKSGTLSVEKTMQLLLPLLGALACAHDRGIIHRDIKPANIALQARHDGDVRAKLLDFGIAQRRDVAGESSLAIGTPSYMAPEQARGDVLTPSVDVWALGVVFFRCLSGRMPFESSSATGLLAKLVRHRAPRFATVCGALSPGVAAALDRALEPGVSRRYQDMRSFARALVIACEQDGIRLPDQPEPVGLPDFQAWRRSADVERTNPLGAGRHRATRETIGYARGARVRSRIFGVALMAASIGAILGMTVGVQGGGVREPPLHDLPSTAIDVPATAVSVMSTGTTAGATTAALPLAAPLAEAEHGAAAAASARGAGPRGRPHRRDKHNQIVRAASPSFGQTVEAADKHPGIVTDWEWE